MLDIRVIELVEFSAAVIIFADSGVARFTQLICDRRFCHFGAAQGHRRSGPGPSCYHCESVATWQVPGPVSVENCQSSLAGHGSESRLWHVPLVTVV